MDATQGVVCRVAVARQRGPHTRGRPTVRLDQIHVSEDPVRPTAAPTELRLAVKISRGPKVSYFMETAFAICCSRSLTPERRRKAHRPPTPVIPCAVGFARRGAGAISPGTTGVVATEPGPGGLMPSQTKQLGGDLAETALENRGRMTTPRGHFWRLFVVSKRKMRAVP
jgi:hypothetical protein